MSLRTFLVTGILASTFLSLCQGQSLSERSDTTEKITQLDEVVIRGRRLAERKYGIKKTGVVRFTDGMFSKDENFEIGQVIRLGNSQAQITSINLYISSDTKDSATFRVNFYRYDPDTELPGRKIINTVIQRRQPVKHGWLTFDLSSDNILARGEVLATVEFVPNTAATKKILYDVKIGGTSKSFYRRDRAEQWMRPPHHYCLYVTAITDASIAQEVDDPDTAPTYTLKSNYAKEPISIFVRLPRNYSRNDMRYPVVYLLDGNAYFDAVSSTADLYSRKKKIVLDPIVIGLGYENAYVMDSLRDRDYTFPEAAERDSFKVSGWGDKYYNFIETKIKQFIDSVYRTDISNQTIMGHSLGGYFVLYALSRSIERPLFNNFVAASPSSSYYDNYIVKRLQAQLRDSVVDNSSRLIATIGEYERTPHQTDSFDELTMLFGNTGISVECITFSKTEHMGTAIATFERALASLFGVPK